LRSASIVRKVNEKWLFGTICADFFALMMLAEITQRAS